MAGARVQGEGVLYGMELSYLYATLQILFSLHVEPRHPLSS